MSGSTHVVVIGAGVIGLSVAHFVRARGHRVTIVERGPEGHDCCSLGNAGMIVPSHFTPLAAPGAVRLALRWMLDSRSPFYVRPRLDLDLARWSWRFARSATTAHVTRAAPVLRDLHLASRRLFESLAEATGNEFELVERGLLMLCRTPGALRGEAAAAHRARALGIEARVLGPDETAAIARIPTIVAGSVHYPLDAHLTPHRFVGALARLVRQAGVRLCWSHEVTGWRVEGGRIRAARTREDDIDGDVFVVAGGSWSSGLAQSLGLRLPLQPGKGYSLTLTRPRALPHVCAILSEAHVAVTPMGSSLRVGGTMELSGFEPAVRPARVRQIVDAVSRYFPEYRPEDFAGVPVWQGFRPCSPDGLPFVGRFPAVPNLIAATGHAMMGVSLAPVTGSLVADLVSNEPPSIPIAALAPDRFA